MEKLVSAEKMRALEQKIFDLGIDSFAVMEKAALRIKDEIKKRFKKDAEVLVVCGKGNNGGDGLAVARMLYLDGYRVKVNLPLGTPSAADALKNYEIVKKLGIEATGSFDGFDVIVDAIFGTGLSKDAELEAMDKINSSKAFVISADIPSGINSDSGAICKNAVKADVTVAIGLKKYGHSIYPGKEYCGEIVVADVGIPFVGECDCFETDISYVNEHLPQAKTDAHKGDMGKISVVAGSKGFTGAACLSCMAALKSGGGLVTLFTPENLNEIYEKKLTEAMTKVLDCQDNIDENELLKNIDFIEKTNAVIIGPGLGKKTRADLIITEIFKREIPVIIDADGINQLAENINILKQKKGQTILTPHIGEFSRLTGLMAEEILKNKLQLAKDFAKEYGVVLVLKGAGTIIATPGGKCYINHTGNCGMATGGSGDVLSGIMGALLARNIGGENAAVLGVFIHGLAGDIAMEKLGSESMLPSDVVESLPDAFLKIKNQEI